MQNKISTKHQIMKDDLKGFAYAAYILMALAAGEALLSWFGR